MSGGSWLLGGVGDVFLNRPDPAAAFAPALEALHAVDLLFGNCEGAFTDGPHYAPSAGWRVVAGLANAAPLGPAGFHVMSCANNHTLDAGHAGLADTLKALRDQDIATAGAGADLAEARRPAMLERAGTSVAVLAYSSVYQAGYEARARVPGLAPMRVHSHYYIPEWDAYGKVEPGVRPHVRTIPFPEDMAQLGEAVAAAKAAADVVVASFHWGTASAPAVLMEYEHVLGRAAIDAGADIVFGHHHHYLRGVELYRDRPIFYGLGHFAFDLPGMETALSALELAKLKEMGEHAIYPREGYPLLPFHPDARMTGIALCTMRGAAIEKIGLLPCLINPLNQPVPVSADSETGRKILDYMRRISAAVGLDTRYAEDGPEIVGLRSIAVV
jgi:poly-gamma-glutamate synthesis protein (capsule biosynthesis protein)